MLDVLQLGHPVLREQARALTQQEILSKPIQDLIKEMRLIMEKAPGVGLAAPQLGFPLQLIVVQDTEEMQKKYFSKEHLQERNRVPVPFQVIINPVVKAIGKETAEFFEGCLSIDNLIGIVPRAMEILVECLDEKARMCNIQAKGWFARILQHEVDHLNGIICTDRMYSRSMTNTLNYQKFWNNKKIADIKKELRIS